jgi:amidase
MNALLHLSALEQAALVKSREVSAEQLTLACITRIEEREPMVHAFVQQTFDSALRTARALDRELAPSHRKSASNCSPLAGVPTAMKDLHMVRGTFTRCGSRAFRYLWSPIDDVSASSLRLARMPLLGKVSTSELAILPVVHPDLHAPTRNPWDLTRYSGGSSGGSSAAIAAGMFAIAVASDGAGSIRIPAAFTGLVGHKPTRDALPNPFAMFEKLGLSVIGPHAKTVADAAALMDLLGSLEGRKDSYSERIKTAAPRVRVRFCADNPVVVTAPHIRASVEFIAKLLQAQGHQVDTGEIIRGHVDEFAPMFQFLAAGMIVPSEKSLQPATRWLRAQGRSVKHETAMAAREMFRERVDSGFAEADVWLTPTVAVDPPKVGSLDGLDGEAIFRAVAPLGAFTAALNASGNPATSVPFHPRKHGIDAPTECPVGIQLSARRGQDVLCLQIAQELLAALNTPKVLLPS